MDGGCDGMMMGGPGWMIAWMLIWLLIVGAILAVAVFGIVRFSQPRRESRDEALELLRRRYAAGEIDKDEYTSRVSDLGRSP